MSSKKYVLVVFAVVFFASNVYGYDRNKDLPAPNNFTVFADTMRIGILWEAPDSSSYHFLRYELYRLDIGKYFIFEELPTETYFDYMVDFEEYTYWVTAVYIEGESQPSDTQTITPLYKHILGGSVMAYVSDYLSNPIENARVVLNGYNGINYSVLSDSYGDAYINQIRLGSYYVDYYHPCYYPTGFPYILVFDAPGSLIIYLGFGMPIILTSPDSIYNTISTGEIDSVSIHLQNTSYNTFLWSVNIVNNSSPNSDWITLSDSAGTIAAGEEIDLQVYFDATNDTTSTTYSCDISFLINYEVTIAEIPVTLEVVNYSIDNEPEEFTQILTANPNPFRSTTTIRFSTTRLHSATPWQAENTEYAEIRIYNIKGQLLRELHPVTSSPSHSIEINWDGKDKHGQKVTPGVYLYQLCIDGEYKAERKCLLIE